MGLLGEGNGNVDQFLLIDQVRFWVALYYAVDIPLLEGHKNSVFVTILGDKIKSLRAEGMSYKAIAKAIPCSTSTISYFLAEGGRDKVTTRSRNRRQRISQKLKASHGGQCVVCGYNKCLEALEFDHLYPKDKSMGVSEIRHKLETALLEAAKCLLLCCRCHRERHAGLLDIGAHMEPTI